MGRREVEPEVVDSVDRALAILECFSTDRPELGISEISRELGMHKSTVFRSLASLEARGLVAKNPLTRRYTVGAKILKPAGAYLTTVDVREKAKPFMESLRSRTKETVSLYVPAGDRCVCIERLESPLEVRRVIRVGDQVPLYAGSTGKVVLAFLPEAARRQLLSRLAVEPPADPIPSTPEALEAELALIRERGYAISREERVAQVSSASAPIFDVSGGVAASLSVSGPTIRFGEERVGQYARLVVQAAGEISRLMGYGLHPNDIQRKTQEVGY